MDGSHDVERGIGGISVQESGRDQEAGGNKGTSCDSKEISSSKEADGNQGTGRGSQVTNRNNRRVGRVSERLYKTFCNIVCCRADSTRNAACIGFFWGGTAGLTASLLAAVVTILGIHYGTDIARGKPDLDATAVGIYLVSGLASEISAFLLSVLLGILISVCVFKRKERATSYNIGRQRAYVHDIPVGQSGLDEIPVEREQSFTDGQGAQVVRDLVPPEVVVHGPEKNTPPMLVHAGMSKTDQKSTPKDQTLPGCSIELRDLKPTSPSVPVEYEESFTASQSI